MNLFDDGKKIAITVRPLVIIPCERLLAIREMAGNVERPIIFPLSNPTRLHEAKPADLYHWTDDGKKIAITVRPLVIIPCERLLAFRQLVTEGFYKEDIIREMAGNVERPIIFPLSNPTRLHEAKPADLYRDHCPTTRHHPVRKIAGLPSTCHRRIL
jgi:malic enzyme